MIPLRYRRLASRMVIVTLCLLVGLLVCLGCVLFIQFYPFTIDQVLTRGNYPKVTTLRSGKSGDPVNVMILGSRAEVILNFKRAGWKIPDPITLETSAKIAADSLANLSYPTAPVSNLYLYNRKQDLAFEMPTNNVQNRGHIRLWDTHSEMNNEEVWLGAASYDRGIELSGTTHFPTHHIAPNVDEERNRVAQDLRPFMASEWVVQFRQPDLFGTNGGDDWYYTDGMMVILSARRVPLGEFRRNTVTISVKQQLLQLASPLLGLL